MKPRTQIILGNVFGMLTLAFFVTYLLWGFYNRIGMISFFLFFIAGGLRTLFDARQDCIRIEPDGRFYLNGRLTTFVRLPEELQIGDPYLLHLEDERPYHGIVRSNPSAFQPRVKWSVLVERDFSRQSAPQPAVNVTANVIALLERFEIPYSCIWMEK